MKTKSTSGNNDMPTGSEGIPQEPVLTCEDFQGLLFAYMSRELGDTQSMFVREHIRKCDRCRSEAAEIESTLALLKSASKADVPEDSRLTDERRKRILRAVFHPVMNWIDMHHKLVSVLLAIVALIVSFFFLRDFEIFRTEPLEEGIPIWRMFKSGDLPELVEKGLQESGDRGQKTEDSALPTPNGGDGNE
jgi:hypothetical protein